MLIADYADDTHATELQDRLQTLSYICLEDSIPHYNPQNYERRETASVSNLYCRTLLAIPEEQKA